MKGLLIAAIMAFAAVGINAQERRAEAVRTGGETTLIFKNTGKLAGEKRSRTNVVKLADPNNAKRLADMLISNVDMPELEVVKYDVNAKYQLLTIVVKNMATTASKQAYVAYAIQSSGINPNTGKPSPKKVLYYEGVGLPSLKGGEETKVWFDLTKSGEMFKDIPKTFWEDLVSKLTVNSIEVYLVKEPIIIK